MQQSRIVAHHGVIVRGTWCPSTRLTITMTILCLTSIPSTKLQWQRPVRMKSLWYHWNGSILDRLSCHHKDSTYGRTQSCHHTNPIAMRTVDMSISPATTGTQTGRTLDLPPHELNHGEAHLSSMRAITLVNHSLGGSSVLWMSSHSNAAKPTSFPYCFKIAASSTMSRAKYIQTRTWSKSYAWQKMTKNVQNLFMNIMNIEKKFLIPPVFARFFFFFFFFGGGGYCPFCPFWGDIGPSCHQVIYVLARIICSSFPWFNLFILPWVKVHSLPSSPS